MILSNWRGADSNRGCQEKHYHSSALSASLRFNIFCAPVTESNLWQMS
jgi:hypothetical protein